MTEASLQSPSTSTSTRLYGVLGWPVAHSLSPRIHSAAIGRMGLDAVYLAFAVPPARLAAVLGGLDAAGVAGLSVTAPHKEKVLGLLEHATDLAGRLGAVNTIFRREDGALAGGNTDVGGIEAAIREISPVLNGGGAVVAGAGGAAAAAVAALCRCGAAEVTLLSRRPEQAERLCSRLETAGLTAGATLRADRLRDGAKALEEAAVIVQATAAPVSEGPPLDLSRCPRSAIALEMSYDAKRPARTAFLDRARAAGITTIDGLQVLVHQGLLAWELWRGEALDVASANAMFEISRSYRRIRQGRPGSQA